MGQNKNNVANLSKQGPPELVQAAINTEGPIAGTWPRRTRK